LRRIVFPHARPGSLLSDLTSVRIASVTCGAGASTGFAIGEELIGSLFDSGATA